MCIQIYTILHCNVEVGDKVYAVGTVLNTNTVNDGYEDDTYEDRYEGYTVEDVVKREDSGGEGNAGR